MASLLLGMVFCAPYDEVLGYWRVFRADNQERILEFSLVQKR